MLQVQDQEKCYISTSRVFLNSGCLRKICRIFWAERISNKELYTKTKSKMWCWRSSADAYDGLGMSSEWIRTIYPRQL